MKIQIGRFKPAYAATMPQRKEKSNQKDVSFTSGMDYDPPGYFDAKKFNKSISRENRNNILSAIGFIALFIVSCFAINAYQTYEKKQTAERLKRKEKAEEQAIEALYINKATNTLESANITDTNKVKEKANVLNVFLKNKDYTEAQEYADAVKDSSDGKEISSAKIHKNYIKRKAKEAKRKFDDSLRKKQARKNSEIITRTIKNN